MDRKNIFEDSGISLNQLRSKQSVRTTFKLPQEVISLLSVLSGQLGIKQKSLLDQLTEDITQLNKIARTARSLSQPRPSCQQKTFVMSKSALQAINEVAKKRGIPRDVLLELSIRRLLPVIDEEQEKHQRRKKVFHSMLAQLHELEELRRHTAATLGQEDDFYRMVNSQVILAQKNLRYAKAFIEKGQALEDW